MNLSLARVVGFGTSLCFPLFAALPSLSAGDQAFRERADSRKAERALEIFRSYSKRFPSQAELKWRVAMACYYVGFKLEKQNEEKVALFAEGRDRALEGLEISEKCAPCAFWAAINMALYGEQVGKLKMLFSLARIRELLRTSHDWDPSYLHGGALRLLGMIDLKLPGILGGDNKRAEGYFKEALEQFPKEPLNYFVYYQFLTETGEPAKAKTLVRRSRNLKLPPPEWVESREAYHELAQIPIR